eukprot:TRINITY_DN8584_c0_g1_i4.p1 TRINITY_DN8584_c0_g1~~TRINITY_DN8584_c0_g1_i4.p1  ORF type:complete len:246 (+),score=42.66 TRINITY_DN8584_c0_g1_i4:292-1029(+)
MQAFTTLIVLAFVVVLHANVFWDVAVKYTNDDCTSIPAFVSIVKVQNDVCLELSSRESQSRTCTADALIYVEYNDTNCQSEAYRESYAFGTCIDSDMVYCASAVDLANIENLTVETVFTGYEDSACTKPINIFGSAAGACNGNVKYRKVGNQIYLHGCDTPFSKETSSLIATAGECISGDGPSPLAAPYIKVGFSENGSLRSFLAAAGAPIGGPGNNTGGDGNTAVAAAGSIITALFASLVAGLF